MLIENLKTWRGLKWERSSYSPSKLAMWQKCIGFVNKPFTNAAASRGTAIHAAIEQALNRPNWADTYADFDEDDDIGKATERALDVLRSLLKGEEYQLFTEQPLATSLSNVWGTADCIVVKGSRALLIDWKSGASAYNAKTSLQMKTYALSLLEAGAQQVDALFVLVDQPRNAAMAHFTEADIPEIRSELLQLIDQVMHSTNETQKLTTGQQCRWCARSLLCPKVGGSKLTNSLAGSRAEAVPLTPERLYALHNTTAALKTVLEQWEDEFRKSPELIASAEGVITLVNRAAPRKYDMPKLMESLVASGQLELLTERTLLSNERMNKKLKRLDDEMKQSLLGLLEAHRKPLQHIQVLRYDAD